MNLFYYLCGDLLEVVHWQREVGCLGNQGSYLTARKPPWDGGRMGWDGGRFYKEWGYD